MPVTWPQMENDFTILSASVSDRGLSENRPQNEDSFLELRQCGIFAVADGVGGAQGGEVASQMAIEILSEAFTNKPEGKDAEDILRAAIESANAAIYQTSRDLPALESMATTIVALHVVGNVATIGHVGDSRLYRLDDNGVLHRETEDHSMVADEVRAGRMTAEQAETHPSRNIINRALGAEPAVEIDLKTILVEPGTTFLLCSDGITRHIDDGEIQRTLSAGIEPETVCGYLKTLCFERGAEDNLTAVVVQVGRIEPAEEVARPTISADENEDTITTPRSGLDSTGPRDVSVFSTTGTFLSLDHDHEEAAYGWFSRVSTWAGILLIGAVIGAAIYHLAFVPSTPQALPAPVLSEMKSDNIEITSYEKLRRTVDTDPAAYLKEVPPPRDAEDFYLSARAQMLTGDFSGARTSLLQAQKLLANSDASNARVLETDIASALTVSSDLETQKRFRSEIEAASNLRATAPANTNVIR